MEKRRFNTTVAPGRVGGCHWGWGGLLGEGVSQGRGGVPAEPAATEPLPSPRASTRQDRGPGWEDAGVPVRVVVPPRRAPQTRLSWQSPPTPPRRRHRQLLPPAGAAVRATHGAGEQPGAEDLPLAPGVPQGAGCRGGAPGPVRQVPRGPRGSGRAWEEQHACPCPRTRPARAHAGHRQSRPESRASPPPVGNRGCREGCSGGRGGGCPAGCPGWEGDARDEGAVVHPYLEKRPPRARSSLRTIAPAVGRPGPPRRRWYSHG